MEQPNTTITSIKLHKKPAFWLSVSVIFYTVFELLNAQGSCNLKSIVATGIFGFLGFTSLFISGIILFKQWRTTKKLSALWLVIIALMIVLSLLDSQFGKACFFDRSTF